MLFDAVAILEELRREHNGIGGVYVYMGHDGDNLCELKDGSSKVIGRGRSGRSLLEAVERAKADWKGKIVVGCTVRLVGGGPTMEVLSVSEFDAWCKWDVRTRTHGETGLPTVKRFEVMFPVGCLERVAGCA
jgi:hypothetical protein